MTKKTENAEPDNMEIWDQVCTTDKDFTKDATGKGFACTSINPQYIWGKLTKLFGPCGIGWGYTVLNEEYRDGHADEDNKTVLHVIKVGFWYTKDGKRSENIESFGQTYFVRKTSGGWKTDEEAPKKSLTDALTKAASMIGVSADIFMGKWDGHKDQSGVNRNTTTVPTTTQPEGNGHHVDQYTNECPKCGKAAIIASKFDDAAFVCYKKKGGCGEKFQNSAALKPEQDDVPMDNVPLVNVGYIADADRKKLFSKADKVGMSHEDLKLMLDGSFGIQSTTEIPVEMFEEILAFVN